MPKHMSCHVDIGKLVKSESLGIIGSQLMNMCTHTFIYTMHLMFSSEFSIGSMKLSINQICIYICIVQISWCFTRREEWKQHRFLLLYPAFFPQGQG